ncbi:hypothetical protein BS78_07G003100 [Paspalum vaginatum]|nr:hypothetical protein BS78_07G003100 [Paspalum vaginatum]
MATRALGAPALPPLSHHLPFPFVGLHPRVGALMAAPGGLLASMLFPTPIDVHTSQIVASSKISNCSGRSLPLSARGMKTKNKNLELPLTWNSFYLSMTSPLPFRFAHSNCICILVLE